VRIPPLHRPLLSIALPLLASLVLVRPAHAQKTEPGCAPPVRRDSSVDADPRRMLEAMVLFVVLPPALLHLPGVACDAPGDRELGLARNHVAVFVGGGGLVNGNWKGGPATTAAAEVVLRGVYADLHVEQYWWGGDERIRLWDARAGYLDHPTRALATGVTVGYRDASGAPGDWGVEGVEIGVPIVLGRDVGWMLWEPTYVISRGHLRVSPRARLDVVIPRTPLVARLDIDSKGVLSRNPFVATLSLGVGAGHLPRP
jgi:hypothetical protein